MPCQLHEVYLRPTVLFNFIIFITTWNLRFRSAATAGCHGNYRSIVQPLVANSPISVDSVRFICTPSFHIICLLGSLGTNHISTAPPAVPDSATKYTEATGGLRSVTLFEAPSRNPLVWGTADDSSGYLFPTPTPPFCVCVCVNLDRFSFMLVYFPLVLPRYYYYYCSYFSYC